MLDTVNNRPVNWNSIQTLPARSYDCSFCGNRVSSILGFSAARNAIIYTCTHCYFPTFFGVKADGTTEMRLPDVAPGSSIDGIPPNIDALYSEVRNAVTAGAYTAAVLVCRKMLIDLAVSQGAVWEKGKRFTVYVEHLAGRVFAPSYSATWLDRIRADGNKATHELGILGRADAILLIEFVEMLLKVLFEYPLAATASVTVPPVPRVAPDTDAGAGNRR